MPIVPLPVMLEEEDRKIYEQLEPPKTIVVRYGYQRKIAELPYSGDATPGCGSKMVIRTDRGTEIGEMLTTTCANSGCGKSVSRKQMLGYIEASGGKDFPFTTSGKVLRVATVDDVREQSHLDSRKPEMIKVCKRLIKELELDMSLVDVELLLGGERIIFYYYADEWVDFRELVKKLASEVQSRIEMCQVNAREEARLVADYEKCGQHCCCKQFLKVLKPVSMRSAKVQKATLDPHKISGRCGRLMCCLRYEDKTYSELKKKLPHRKSLVETEDGIGIVWSTQILTQLALVKVGHNPAAAYPVENLRVLSKEEVKEFQAKEREEQAAREERQWKRKPRGEGKDTRRDDKRGPKPEAKAEDAKPAGDKPVAEGAASEGAENAAPQAGDQPGEGTAPGKRRRRRRRRGGRSKEGGAPAEGTPQAEGQGGGGGEARDNTPPAEGSGGGEQGGKDGPRRRRRRRRRRGGGGGGGQPGGGDSPSGGDGGS